MTASGTSNWKSNVAGGRVSDAQSDVNRPPGVQGFRPLAAGGIFHVEPLQMDGGRLGDGCGEVPPRNGGGCEKRLGP